MTGAMILLSRQRKLTLLYPRQRIRQRKAKAETWLPDYIICEPASKKLKRRWTGRCHADSPVGTQLDHAYPVLNLFPMLHLNLSVPRLAGT